MLCSIIDNEECNTLTYKIMVFSMYIEVPDDLYVRNGSIFKSVTRTDSCLNKRQLSICDR